MGDAIATNKKAYRDYFLTDKWEAGIALNGGEVKSVRSGGVNFKASFARADHGEVFLYNVYIEPYASAGLEVLEPERPRKLLLRKNEIKKIEGRLAQRNLTLVPTKIYFNDRGLVKVEVALGKGKKLYDKRETIKKRSLDRDIGRAIRNKQTKR